MKIGARLLGWLGVYGDRLPFMMFAAFGTLFCLLGAAFAVEPVRAVTSSARAEGYIVDFVESSDDDGTAYTPVVQFKTPDGKLYEFRGGVASSPPEYKREQKVTVLYDPAQPAQAKLATFLELWLFPGMFVLMGVIFGAIGFVGLFCGRK